MRERQTFVYVHLAHGAVPAGRLRMIEDGRSSYAEFEYGARYLERADRLTIDPVALPLPPQGERSPVFRTPAQFANFNGIRDAAPDGWGRYLMDKAAGPEVLDEFDYLVGAGDERIG